MLCSINEKELTLYEVELNKNRLKAIRKNIIAKYGKINATCINLSMGEFFDIVKNQEDIMITDLEIKRNRVSFISFEIPRLAILLKSILKGQENAIYELETYRSYYDFLVERGELQGDDLGTIYIQEILDNIKLVPVQKENYADIFDVLYKLKHSGDENLRNSAKEMEKVLIPNDLVDEMNFKVKKMDILEFI